MSLMPPGLFHLPGRADQGPAMLDRRHASNCTRQALVTLFRVSPVASETR